MKSIEMTSGSLWKNILLFSLPLMLTQVLEVLFNLSDVAIAGKYAYNTYVALGAVGSTTTLVSLFTGLLIGMGAGVNVSVARWLGIGDSENVERTTHSSLLICTGAGVLVCLICAFFAEPMLRLLNTKEEFLPGAVLYLRIYALGLPGIGIYNCGNGILSATGDTKRPLIYLSVAGVLNVILNLVFVIGCRMSAEGVAIASAIAQWVSAVLIVVHLLRRKDACRLSMRQLRLHKAAVKRILMIGVPSGLQNAIFALANLFVQAGLNSFDEITVSGAAAAANADTLVFNMMAAFYTACASFVSRNWGAGHKERILKSYHICMLYGIFTGAIFWRDDAAVRTAVPVPVRQRARRHRRRHGPSADHGFLLRHSPADGQQHRRLPRHRQEHHPHHRGHHGLLRVPRGVDLHGVRLLPHGAVSVPAVYLLLVHHRRGGVLLLPHQLQKEHRGRADLVKSAKRMTRRGGSFFLPVHVSRW